MTGTRFKDKPIVQRGTNAAKQEDTSIKRAALWQ
jgi:hypothetical protein